MASPQLENGHTRIANELLRAIYRHQFSASGLRVVLWVVRGSYGWNKKMVHEWSYRAASEDLNMPIGSVHLAMQVLIDSGVIKKDEHGRLALIKDYESWSCVQPTERAKAFSPLNETVQPTERRAFSPLNAYKEKDKQIKKERKGTNIPPSIEEVKAYCIERNNRVDPSRFWNYYQTSGWMRGKNKIKDWMACIHTWEQEAGFKPAAAKKPTEVWTCKTCGKGRPEVQPDPEAWDGDCCKTCSKSFDEATHAS
jgi:phage replication O-like protein O